MRRRGLVFGVMAASVALFADAASALDICNNTNAAPVKNGAPPRSPCAFGRPAHVTALITWHWNGGHGAAPGAIALVNPFTGARYGPFPAAGSPGPDGAPSAIWTARVDLALPPGAYWVMDSDPATWSWNNGSITNGFIKVEGDYIARGVAHHPHVRRRGPAAR